MLERFSEKARRLIFFGRYEASQYGSPCIETEHLLLGLIREDKTLAIQFLRVDAAVDSIRKEIEGRITRRERISTTVEIPLCAQSKHVLAVATKEADQLSHKIVGTGHVLVGLLLEEKSLAAEILRGRGLKVSEVRKELARWPHGVPPLPFRELTVLRGISRDLTQAAINGDLSPIFARDQEIDGLIEVLCSFTHRNPALIGRLGVGKSAVVEGLAHRIADGDVPLQIIGKRIVALDLAAIVDSAKDRRKLEDSLNAIVKELVKTPDVIVFIEELLTLTATSSITASVGAAEILKPALLQGEIQCICACTPDDYEKSIQAIPWLKYCFRAVNVLPLNEDQTILVLHGCKNRYEKFHQVVYTEEALKYASHYSILYFPGDIFLAKAMEILDTAGSHVKLRAISLPGEVVEAKKRVKYATQQMEWAIANHEFEKARKYSEEEHNESEKLRQICERLKLDESVKASVTREDIEDVVSRWTGISATSIRQEDVTSGLAPTPTPGGSSISAQKHRRPTLRVFMCHSTKDKPAVRDLYNKLKKSQIDPWLDEENLLPGQEWDYEINSAVRSCHVVIVCLSQYSVNKAGYLQKEIKKVLDVADEQPEGAIYVIPVKLEECDVPSRLRRWHWVNLFEPKGFERLIQALSKRAKTVGLNLPLLNR